MINISERIKELRLKSGWTQKEVAEKLNITQAGYQKLESSDSDITFSRLQQIADVFGMSVTEVINYPNGAAGAISEELERLRRENELLIQKNNELEQNKLLYDNLLKNVNNKLQSLFSAYNDIYMDMEFCFYVSSNLISGLDVDTAYKKALEEWHLENIGDDLRKNSLKDDGKLDINKLKIKQEEALEEFKKQNSLLYKINFQEYIQNKMLNKHIHIFDEVDKQLIERAKLLL